MNSKPESKGQSRPTQGRGTIHIERIVDYFEFFSFFIIIVDCKGRWFVCICLTTSWQVTVNVSFEGQ